MTEVRSASGTERCIFSDDRNPEARQSLPEPLHEHVEDQQSAKPGRCVPLAKKLVEGESSEIRYRPDAALQRTGEIKNKAACRPAHLYDACRERLIRFTARRQ